MDGASSAKGAGARVVIITPKGILLEHSFRLGFNASNNEAEYEALLAGLRAISWLEARDVEIYSDSRLIVNQVQGNFEARDPRMKAYLDLVRQVMDGFCTVKVIQVARAQNRHADSLATLASSIAKDIPQLIRVELVLEPSIKVAGSERAERVEVTAVATLGPSWMDPIVDFLADDLIPDDEKEANKVHRVVAWYWLSGDRKLYRRSFGGPYLSCLHPEKVGQLLAELHKEICGSHVGGRSLAHWAMTQGFWWPWMQKDVVEYVRKCEQCNRRFVLVAVDYFTKWAEAKALANIWDVDVKKFIWKNIITRFGVPNSLISDNELQFESRSFREFCSNLGIRNRYSTPAYPQGNGQAEAVNKVIVNDLKRKLEGAKGNWAEELPSVLWAYRTTPQRSTGKTPFSLTYGAKAVIPAKINLCRARVSEFDTKQNEGQLTGCLDLLEEHREAATIRLAEY
ncbi:uncharacterized protein LOC126699902 [Quercus robur]|uniref:uncharacterized protein LOC126699902 n=1 Tax=Quercus robur TaxID=38942 RepID=UPI0021627721|nr:uncharacterized protein LOC126699902 [Quercus robur]